MRREFSLLGSSGYISISISMYLYKIQVNGDYWFLRIRERHSISKKMEREKEENNLVLFQT